MKVIQAVIEIKVDEENIRNLYPDFDATFSDIEDFVRAVHEAVQTDSEGSLEELGYSVRVVDDATLLPLTYSDN